MLDIDSSFCIGTLLQVPHLELCLLFQASYSTFSVESWGHKKAHINKLSKVCKNSGTILVNPKGGGTILDTLNLRVCHRNQSSKKMC